MYSVDNQFSIKSFLESNIKSKWEISYRIKVPGESFDGNCKYMHSIDGLELLIRVEINKIMVYYWMYNLRDAKSLIHFIHSLNLEAHEIIIKNEIKMFYDIDLLVADDELEDLIEHYENMSGCKNYDIEDVSRHLAYLYYDATLLSLEENGNDLNVLKNYTDMMFTTRNRTILQATDTSFGTFKISIHIITDIVAPIFICKEIAENVKRIICNNKEKLNLPESYEDLISDAIDSQPYKKHGSLSTIGGVKIANGNKYTNNVIKHFHSDNEEPFITKCSKNVNKLNLSNYAKNVNTKTYTRNFESSSEFVEEVLQHIENIPNLKRKDWDIDSNYKKGNTLILRRINPSYCSACNRTHDKNNTLIIIFNEEMRYGAWKCLHNSGMKSEKFWICHKRVKYVRNNDSVLTTDHNGHINDLDEDCMFNMGIAYESKYKTNTQQILPKTINCLEKTPIVKPLDNISTLIDINECDQ